MNDDLPELDSNLANLAAGGCEESFRGLFDRYYDQIHAYAWRICCDSNSADDVAQQVFIKIASALPKYRHEGKFKSWIFRIALNTARDHLRVTARYRDRIAQLQADQPKVVETGASDLRVTEVLEKLPDKIRETVVLVHAQGFTQKEAADLMGCPEGTVSWRISEARKILRTSCPNHD